MRELIRRVVFALVAAPLAVAIIYIGDALLATLLGGACALAAWEFFSIARRGGAAPMEAWGIVLAGLLPLGIHAERVGLLHEPITLGAIGLLVLLGGAIWARGPNRHPLSAVSVTAFGVLYCGCLAYVYALRHHDYAVGAQAGTALALLPLVIVWATDIGAYVVGSAFGGARLAPAISPGKTVSGGIGGLVLGVAGGVAYIRLALPHYAHLAMLPLHAVLFAAIVSSVAQMGDLAESLLKREAGVKDASHIIPGHGGVLDRVDSLLFALPVAYLLLGWMLVPAFA